jgi:hypothetical protein
MGSSPTKDPRPAAREGSAGDYSANTKDKFEDGDGRLLDTSEHELLRQSRDRLLEYGIENFNERLHANLMACGDDSMVAILTAMPDTCREKMYSDLVSHSIVSRELRHMEALAPRHHGKGIREQHFVVLKAGVLKTCSEVFLDIDGAWTDAMQLSYSHAFDTVANYLRTAMGNMDEQGEMSPRAMKQKNKKASFAEASPTEHAPKV